MNTRQQWISRARIGAARAALALMVVPVLGLDGARPAQARGLTVLYNFAGSSDGGDPFAGLIRDSAGNLYGTADYGGTAFAGAVFKVAPDGTETVLYSFSGGADGAQPFSALVRDKAGNLYGTTTMGGSANAGVVFKLDPGGTETVLHNFIGGTDGTTPTGGLLEDKGGNFYGTASQGGTSNAGVLFKIGAKGKYSILHTFTGAANDGKYPTYTSLLMDSVGALYGVTEEGGAANGGILYKFSKTGKLTILHSFMGGTTDGCNVLGTPFIDGNGTFYGTTSSCGASSLGTVWMVSANGNETVLHSFAGGTTDGEYPLAGVIVDASGNIYGNTETGGASNFGTVYGISPNGTFALLHSFDGADGKFPYGSFVRTARGTLFGTTQNGGTIGYGTVWKMRKVSARRGG
ncbi:MAG TPA: choice-of-anchor tandem repeat GloVer-containing protein [Rhizomicrobium sp.]|nr:choice-of-anchor tandem repeat GloVer-containing protein [Rhizomicrobium sp.]